MLMASNAIVMFAIMSSEAIGRETPRTGVPGARTVLFLLGRWCPDWYL